MGMPKISEARRTARREQIIRAALRCAARSGLHGMTMAEVIAESGLSAGAVYGYFTGKSELISAVVDTQLGWVRGTVERALQEQEAPDPVEVLRALAAAVDDAAHGPDGDITVVILQGWADAARGGETLPIVRPKIDGLIEAWTEVVRRRQARGLLDPAADPASVAKVLHSSVPGYILLRLILGDVTPDDFAAGWRALTTSASPVREPEIKLI